MKKQDMNGVRVAQDLERKYKLQDIEVATAQARAASISIRNKLDILEYEEDMETFQQAIQDALTNYVLISSELTEEDIEEILNEEEENE